MNGAVAFFFKDAEYYSKQIIVLHHVLKMCTISLIKVLNKYLLSLLPHIKRSPLLFDRVYEKWNFYQWYKINGTFSRYSVYTFLLQNNIMYRLKISWKNADVPLPGQALGAELIEIVWYSFRAYVRLLLPIVKLSIYFKSN